MGTFNQFSDSAHEKIANITGPVYTPDRSQRIHISELISYGVRHGNP